MTTTSPSVYSPTAPPKPKPNLSSATVVLEFELSQRRAILQRVSYLRKRRASYEVLAKKLTTSTVDTKTVVNILLHLIKLQVDSDDNEMRSWGQISSAVVKRQGGKY